MMDAPVLTARSAFADVTLRRDHPAVHLSEQVGLSLATMQACSGALVELKRRVRETYGLELPMGATRLSARGTAFAGIAPDTWLVSSDPPGNTLASSLAVAFSGVAAVADQSGGFAVLRVSGPSVRDLLSRLIPIDVHERAFPIGRVVATLSGHIGVTVWRLENKEDGAAVFEIALYRSLAASFARALEHALGGLEAPAA